MTPIDVAFVMQGTWRNEEAVVCICKDMRVFATHPEIVGLLRAGVFFETYFVDQPKPARQLALDPEDPLHLAIFLDSMPFWETQQVNPADVFPAPPAPATDEKPGLVY